jgi:preprotein translocase subunit YajC
MFDLVHLLISPAFAQDAAAPAAPGSPLGVLTNYLPFILIFGVFYFLVIRPQQQKLSEQQKMLKALQRGDKVVTSGGIHGKIAKLDGDAFVTIEIANGVEIKLDRGHISGLEAKPVPVVANDEAKK